MNRLPARILPLAGSTRTPLRWLIALLAVPVLAAIAIAFASLHAHGSGRSTPALPLTMLVAPLLIALVAYGMSQRLRRIGVRVEGDELIVDTGFASARIALSTLRAAGLHVVDLHERTELKPRWRTRGTSLPGFNAGWFRLRNGEKALCLLFDQRRVSYLRSDDGVSLLLSLEHPEALRALIETRR